MELLELIERLSGGSVQQVRLMDDKFVCLVFSPQTLKGTHVPTKSTLPLKYALVDMGDKENKGKSLFVLKLRWRGSFDVRTLDSPLDDGHINGARSQGRGYTRLTVNKGKGLLEWGETFVLVRPGIEAEQDQIDAYKLAEEALWTELKMSVTQGAEWVVWEYDIQSTTKPLPFAEKASE